MPKGQVDTVDRQIGAAIRRERERRGMTLATVAVGAGCSWQMLSHYEFGRQRIYIGRLVKIAQVLERPVTFFLRGVG